MSCRANRSGPLAASALLLAAIALGTPAAPAQGPPGETAVAGGVTATRTGNVLTITGSPGNDLVTLTRSEAETVEDVVVPQSVVVTIGGQRGPIMEFFEPPTIDRYFVDLGDGRDSLIDKTIGGTVNLALGPGDDLARDEFYGAFSAGPGNDVVIEVEVERGSVRAGPGNDKLIGGRFNDRFSGGPGNDRLFGGQGDDLLKGSAGFDRCYGGGNFDFYAAPDKPDRAPGCEVKRGVP